jgi:thymidylate synthase ThyX
MENRAVLRFYDGDEGTTVEEFTDDEKKELEKVITNTESNVFAWKLGEQFEPEQCGALLSRYSRTVLTGKKLYLNEFLPNKNRGREFFQAWFSDYGDDSIQEMVGGMPVSCEYVSNVAVKDIEDGRVASYIEKSSRYVAFDKRLPNGDFMYYKDPAIMGSRFGEAYVQLMDSLFESYIKYTPIMMKYIREGNKLEDQTFRIGDYAVKISELTSEMVEKNGIDEKDLTKAYENSVKANALDFVRDYLPMSTLTHVGIAANVRSYESMILKMMASPLAESKYLANCIYTELYKLVPSLMQRIKETHGQEYVKFLSEKNENTRKLVRELTKSMRRDNDSSLDLLDYTGRGTGNPNDSAQIAIVSAIFLRYGEALKLKEATEKATELSSDERQKLIDTYTGKRTNRRQKPGRAYESVKYSFGLAGRVGIYRDLQRHRIGTQERSDFNVDLGFKTRDAFVEIGIADEYQSKMGEAIDLFKGIHETMPLQAQYVVPYGFDASWYYKFSARQLYHFGELRTTPAGHPDYRKIVQQMVRKVEEVHPCVTKNMSYVNFDDKTIGRLDSEIRIAKKRNKQT